MEREGDRSVDSQCSVRPQLPAGSSCESREPWAAQGSCCGGAWLSWVSQDGCCGCCSCWLWHSDSQGNQRCSNPLSWWGMTPGVLLHTHRIYSGVFNAQVALPGLLLPKAFKKLMHFPSLEEFCPGCSCPRQLSQTPWAANGSGQHFMPALRPGPRQITLQSPLQGSQGEAVASAECSVMQRISFLCLEWKKCLSRM